MSDGKNAVGLKGFPTPNTAAGIAGYLLFLLDDKEYAQWILGALEPLVYDYNFYESGDLSTDEAAELFRGIVQQAPYNLKTCANPAGGKILRIAETGHVQQLSDANTWEDPDGDYAIPPVPEREEGTADEQKCLAAKNAAHVLELLYENITDSFNEDLDEAEAATALTLTIVGLLGSEFAPITFALITFFAVVFSVLYGLLEFIGADLWDEAFTDTIACILLECASNDAGVVTFDYDCFNNALAAQTNVFSLTFEQLRLFGQIQYLLLVIGGVDALNLAGATTAITDDDCDFCETNWCRNIQDTSDLDVWVPHSWDGEPVAVYTGGRWEEAGVTNSKLWISYTLSTPTEFTDAAILDLFYGSGVGNGSIWVNGAGAFPDDGTRVWLNGGIVGAPFPLTVSRIDIALAWAGHTDTLWVAEMQYSGTGDNPFGDNNCG